MIGPHSQSHTGFVLRADRPFRKTVPLATRWPSGGVVYSIIWGAVFGLMLPLSCILPVIYRQRPRLGRSRTRAAPHLDVAEPVDDGVESGAHHRRGLVLDDDGRPADRRARREVAAVVDRHLAKLAVERVEDAAVLG